MKELILTEKEKEILMNLILGEFNSIRTLNANIYFKIQEYEKDLHAIYKKIMDSTETKEE